MVHELEEYCEHYRSRSGCRGSSSSSARSSADLIVSCGDQVGKACHSGSCGATHSATSAGNHFQPHAPQSPSSLPPNPQQFPLTTSTGNPTAIHSHHNPAPAGANSTPPFRFQQGTYPSPIAQQASVSAPSFYQHTTAPLPHWYRPVLVYGAFEFMAWMNRNMLTWAGFRAHSLGCLEYFTFNVHGCWGSKGVQQDCMGADGRPLAPVVLLHGVGCGLMPYFKLLITLASAGVPVIAVEYKHVGQRWCGHEVPSLLDLRDGVLDILKRHEIFGPGTGRGAHIIAHSFGSAVASTILQAEPGAVASLSLLDPICFHMWIPSLLINFIYRPLNFFHPKSDLGFGRGRKRPAPVSSSKNESSNPSNLFSASSYPLGPSDAPPHPPHLISPTAASPLLGPTTATTASTACPRGMSALCSDTAAPAAGGSSTIAFSGISGSMVHRRGKLWDAGDGGGTLEQVQERPGLTASLLGSYHSSNTSSTCGEDMAEREGLCELLAADTHLAAAHKPEPPSSCPAAASGGVSAGHQQHLVATHKPWLPRSGPAAASIGNIKGVSGGMVGACGAHVHMLCKQFRAWLAWAWSWVPVPNVRRLIKELMLLGPAREMHCAAALCRLMDWRDATLPAQVLAPLALKGKALLALSGKDELLPAPLLASWALNHVPGPPKVHLFPGLRHADILLHGPAQDKLVMEIIQMAYGTLHPREPSGGPGL